MLITRWAVMVSLLMAMGPARASYESEREIWHLFQVMEGCRAVDKRFAEKSAQNYTSWLKLYQPFIDERLEYPYFRQEISESKETMRGANYLFCTDHLVSLIAPTAPQLEFAIHVPDLRFETPEKTWAVWAGALQRADRTAAKECLTDSAKRLWDDLYESAPNQVLQRKAGELQDLKIRIGENQAEAKVIRDGQRAATVYFVRKNREWKLFNF